MCGSHIENVAGIVGPCGDFLKWLGRFISEALSAIGCVIFLMRWEDLFQRQLSGTEMFWYL